MDKSLLFEIWENLDRSERLALGRFLQSPYHNTRTDVLALFDYLKNTLPPYDRMSVFNAVFPGQPFDARALNYVVSYLIKLIEDFWAQEHFETDRFVRHYAALKCLRGRARAFPVERMLRTASTFLNKQPQRNALFFRQHYLIGQEDLREQLKQGRGRDIDLNTISAAHEKAFIIEKLQMGCMLKSRQAVTSKQYDLGLLPIALEYVAQQQWLNEPVVAAWYYAYFLHTQEAAVAHFESLKTLIVTHFDLFGGDEQHDLYLVAVNYCIRQINSGNARFAVDLFDLYREGLAQQVFLENGVLSRWSYNNITNAALKVGQTDWALQFVETHRTALEPAFRDTSYHFNLARCLYEQQQYQSALDALTRIEYDDMLQNLSAKTLQIKIYFNLGAWQALDSLLDSMAIYLRRKKVLGYHKENYSNIIRLVRKGIALPPGDKTERAAFRLEVEQCKVLSEKNWILRMTNDE